FAAGRARLEQTRIATFGAPNPAPQKQNLGLDGDVAYNVAANGTATRASAQVAKDRRMEIYHHPIGALRAALGQGSQVSNARKQGNDDVVDIATAQGAKFSLFVDSGTKLPAPVVTAQEVSKGIWYLAGQTHHSVLVEFADHLALIEAPQNETRTAAVLAKVKELRPNKPLKYLVITHHHFDHSGGVRTVMAQDGVTLITHAGNKAFLEEIAKRPSTIYPDALSKSPKTPTIIGVTDKYE